MRRTLEQSAGTTAGISGVEESAVDAYADEIPSVDDHSPVWRSGLAWGITGFVIGAVFWHFVGFWSFVERIVYNGRTAESSSYVAQSGPDCISLELNRSDWTIQRLACNEDDPLLNEGAQSARGDFLGARSAPVARASSPIRLTSGER